ncbi:Protein YTP1-like C-terminal domain-containing protein [[Candida] zeylanoides]
MTSLVAFAAAAVAAAAAPAAAMEMDMSPPQEFHPAHAGSKTFHWLVCLAFLLVLPSVAATFALAQRPRWALALQFASTAYCVFESLFLAFPDRDGHENRTSRGTSWFLSCLWGACVFVGTCVNGSNLAVNRFYPHLADKLDAHSRLYAATSRLYRVLSVAAVLAGWVRVALAPVALFGFCYGRHTGQCIAHGIMGSSFVAYGFVLTVVLVVPWLRRPAVARRRSQEFYDSTLMMAWGVVNTFTEHRWGKEPWNHGDYQHTAMGIIWWGGGLLGMWQTRSGARRSFVPALLLVFTGWAMSEHVQHSVLSTKVHAMFGLVLMGAGFARVVEISFVLWDAAAPCERAGGAAGGVGNSGGGGDSAAGRIFSFQYLPPFLLVLSGLLFMGANEEQLELVAALGADHSSYIMVVTAAAFVVYLWMSLLVALYLRLVGYDEDGPAGHAPADAYRAAHEFEMSDLEE